MIDVSVHLLSRAEAEDIGGCVVLRIFSRSCGGGEEEGKVAIFFHGDDAIQAARAIEKIVNDHCKPEPVEEPVAEPVARAHEEEIVF